MLGPRLHDEWILLAHKNAVRGRGASAFGSERAARFIARKAEAAGGSGTKIHIKANGFAELKAEKIFQGLTNHDAGQFLMADPHRNLLADALRMAADFIENENSRPVGWRDESIWSIALDELFVTTRAQVPEPAVTSIRDEVGSLRSIVDAGLLVPAYFDKIASLLLAYAAAEDTE